MESIEDNNTDGPNMKNIWEEAMAETRKRMELRQKAYDAIKNNPELSQVEKDLAMIDLVPPLEKTHNEEINIEKIKDETSQKISDIQNDVNQYEKQEKRNAIEFMDDVLGVDSERIKQDQSETQRTLEESKLSDKAKDFIKVLTAIESAFGHQSKEDVEKYIELTEKNHGPFTGEEKEQIINFIQSKK